jgi:hypothetical protein
VSCPLFLCILFIIVRLYAALGNPPANESSPAASPKLLVHVFIGSRLALLLEQGDTMTAGDKAINYASMIIGGVLGIGVGLVIYRRTMARAAELAREQGEEIGAATGDGDDGGDNAGLGEDEESRLMLDPDAAALVMEDDDISLWETEAGYRDSWDEEEGGAGGDAKAVVNGDGLGSVNSGTK